MLPPGSLRNPGVVIRRRAYQGVKRLANIIARICVVSRCTALARTSVLIQNSSGTHVLSCPVLCCPALRQQHLLHLHIVAPALYPRLRPM